MLLFLFYFSLLGTVMGQSPGLFATDEILAINLKGDLKSFFKDRGEDSQYHPATLEYKADLKTVNIPLRIKTRGHFRKIPGNCKYPPIRLNFKKSVIPENSVFENQKKMKLVTSCRGDEYVIYEYLAYKLYNLVTPKSFNVRLVELVFEDTVKNTISKPSYGILIEEEDQMAKRNQSTSLEKIGLRSKYTEKEDFLKMAIFEYMIGNTDWSIDYQQNIKLIRNDSTVFPIAIPYDFDHAGIVGAPYAIPAPALELRSTLERRYRGYCIPEMDEYISAIETFNRLKDDFYALYDGNPLLSDKYEKKILNFLDQFYETINDPKKLEKEFSYPCSKSGTGNVIIKGLKKHD